MPVFIALLRGINVGGNAIIPMADLRTLCEEEGFTGVRTLLQSGNVVLTAARATPASVAKKLETALKKRLAKDIRVIVRTPDDLRAVVKRNPFPTAARDDPSHLLVNFLAAKPEATAVAALAAHKHAAEPHKIDGQSLYIHYASGVGTSKFVGAVIEKTLATHATARNWNTILKLIALSGET